MSALTDVFTAIANAIRAKKGVSTTYKPSQMADAIRSISTGTDTSDATLNSSDQMLSGVTAYSKGTKYTGNIPNRGQVPYNNYKWSVDGMIDVNYGYYGGGIMYPCFFKYVETLDSSGPASQSFSKRRLDDISTIVVVTSKTNSKNTADANGICIYSKAFMTSTLVPYAYFFNGSTKTKYEISTNINTTSSAPNGGAIDCINTDNGIYIRLTKATTSAKYAIVMGFKFGYGGDDWSTDIL